MPSSVGKRGGLPLKALAPHPLIAGQVELLLDMSLKVAICAVIARRLRDLCGPGSLLSATPRSDSFHEALECLRHINELARNKFRRSGSSRRSARPAGPVATSARVRP
jgi:hypothetical protein